MAKKMSDAQLESIVANLNDDQKEAFLDAVEEHLNVQLIPIEEMKEYDNDDEDQQEEDGQSISELDLQQRMDFINIHILKTSMRLVEKLKLRGEEGLKMYFQSAERLRAFLNNTNSNVH